MVRAFVLTSALLAGCPSPIHSQYEAAREAALADPGPAPPEWQPDAMLHLSPPLVDAVLTAVLEEHGRIDEEVRLRIPIGAATLQPDLEVDRLSLGSSRRCASCLAVDTRLSGQLGWRVAGSDGTLPLTIDAEFDVELAAASDGDEWAVTLRPQDVRRLDVRSRRSSAVLQPLLDGAFQEWVRERLLQGIEPIPVARVGAEGLPLRAVSLAPAEEGIAVSMLTTSPEPTPLPRRRAAQVSSGWRLDIAQDALLALARRAAFEHGPVARGVVVDPTALEITPERFTLGMRLWRPEGRGWWRDYTIVGEVAMRPDRIELKATDVQAEGQSPGAAVADPLAALAEGHILRALEDAIAASLPSAQRQTGHGFTTEVRARALDGSRGVLSIQGDLSVTKAAKPDRRQRPRRR